MRKSRLIARQLLRKPGALNGKCGSDVLYAPHDHMEKLIQIWYIIACVLGQSNMIMTGMGNASAGATCQAKNGSARSKR